LNEVTLALIYVVENLIFIDFISLNNTKLNKNIFLILCVAKSRAKELDPGAALKGPCHRSDSEEVDIIKESESEST
jgi:hypothetical protein